ncbi:MAG TPA: teichoic acid ABC transporter ATP-binding protein [Anaerolineaceae bacterium]|nr:teichoic acid ABC transporter ATP-binding protein [Anaerolineaceae bacterium]
MILHTTHNSTNNEPQQDSAIFLKDVSVHYRLPSETIKTFKEYMIRLVKREIERRSFSALKNINLDVKKGEILGIIGRNGAGKSTLMKVISKVLIPSEGRVWINGQISPLLQLGAGFHPELTGRENIYLNATLLGHSHNQIEQKLNNIIEFAEIGDFIEAPLRTYSSGMRARLGFSVATAWKPDILLLDEVLSVGDVAFREKCVDRMSYFRDQGSTVLIVSHSIESVQETCQNTIWLDKGEIVGSGETVHVCDAYQKEMQRKKSKIDGKLF